MDRAEGVSAFVSRDGFAFLAEVRTAHAFCMLTSRTLGRAHIDSRLANVLLGSRSLRIGRGGATRHGSAKTMHGASVLPSSAGQNGLLPAIPLNYSCDQHGDQRLRQANGCPVELMGGHCTHSVWSS